MTRPRDELAARVEERLEVAGHGVERAAHVRELARPAGGGARTELAARELLGGGLEAVQAPCDPRADEERGGERGRRGCGGDGEDLDVVVHVEHDEPAEDHGGERQPDGEQREPGELHAHGGKPAKREREQRARGERAGAGDEREGDHSVNL